MIKILNFLTCQILSFKSEKIVPRKKFSARTLIEIPIENEHNTNVMHVAKKNRK